VNFSQDLFTGLSLTISDEQLHQFHEYYQFLVSYNEITNLTRITDEKEVYYKHFFDSLSLTNVLDFKSIITVCDMGAGAGFPSIPIKILFPHLHITIVDSLGKRITFLEQLVELLHLTNVNLVHDRSEIFALTHQLTYDMVTARALGHLSLILEMGTPMLKVNGYFIAPKGSHFETEVNESKNAIHTLGMKLLDIKQFDLPYEYGQRANLILKKEKHAKGYPRPYSQMIKKAL
jgi:16S rRNA (guanine527-N7)-methyltransferase